MKARLVYAIISTILEEAAIVAAVLWGLPRLNVHVPIPAMIVIMAVWIGFSIFTYHKGSLALLQKPIKGLVDMTGSKGRVVKALSPSGMVRIKGELWDAESSDGVIKEGVDVEVVRQDSLKLIVKKFQ